MGELAVAYVRFERIEVEKRWICLSAILCIMNMDCEGFELWCKEDKELVRWEWETMGDGKSWEPTEDVPKINGRPERH